MYNKRVYVIVACCAVALITGLPSHLYGQEGATDEDLFISDSFNSEINADQETELVIEDFNTTGLGDETAFGISLGFLFGGSAMLDFHLDIHASPLVAFRLNIAGHLPINVTQQRVAFEFGFGAVWRSYVINRTRFYGGVLIKGNIETLVDFDLLLIPEGFGGFEIYASPTVAIFTEFGGRSGIPIITLNANAIRTDPYEYGSGFFIRVGTRFGF